MSWGVVAIAGASVVGSMMSSKSAKKSSKVASEASQAQIEFARGQYEDWKAVYGPIQDNLSDYYKNLTPEYYESIGLEAVAKEQAQTMERVETNLAQRGIEDSGLSASMVQAVEMDAARQRAIIRKEAPRQTQADKATFLGMGLGVNPAQQVTSVLGQDAAVKQQMAYGAGQAAGQATSSAVSAVGTGLADYFASPTRS